jgi:hypothetical protein
MKNTDVCRYAYASNLFSYLLCISSVSFRPSLVVLKKYLKILMANKKLIKIYMGEELKFTLLIIIIRDDLK